MPRQITFVNLWKNQMRSTFERRERDLNPRVQGTVDFESTAIPGYAISACLLPVRHRHKRDASQST